MTRVGQIVGGRYRLAHVIGAGAMGEVYRARVEPDARTDAHSRFADEALPDEVAVKILRPERSRQREAVERFLAEVRATRALHHPSIVRAFDEGETEEGHPFVVMELLRGRVLRSLLLKKGRVDRGTALAVVLPVLAALEVAHAHGVIHRDVKPENLHVSRSAPDGSQPAQVKVLDFGIAKVLDASLAVGHNTTAGMVVGTPGYFAPEQAKGEPFDARADLFAVGAVLFELLTGQRAFDGPSPVAVAAQVVTITVPRLADLDVDAPPTLQAALDRALAKRPEDRFGSARELAKALEPLAPGELGQRILLDSWLASAAAVPGAAPTPLPKEQRDGSLAQKLGEKLAAVAIDGSPTDARMPALLAACAPTLKSSQDPLSTAVEARASSRPAAVEVANRETVGDDVVDED